MSLGVLGTKTPEASREDQGPFEIGITLAATPRLNRTFECDGGVGVDVKGLFVGVDGAVDVILAMPADRHRLQGRERLGAGPSGLAAPPPRPGQRGPLPRGAWRARGWPKDARALSAEGLLRIRAGQRKVPRLRYRRGPSEYEARGLSDAPSRPIRQDLARRSMSHSDARRRRRKPSPGADRQERCRRR